MRYFVSRQRYWPDGTNVVEVAAGGMDYANPDMLSIRCADLGEGEEFDDPREAAESAIAICDWWRMHGCRRAKVAHGATGGMTMPFDPTTYPELRKWAKAAWQACAKCPTCGGPQPPKRERFWAWGAYRDGEEFCSAECVKNAEEEVKQD